MRIERDESPIKGYDKDLAIPGRDAPIDHVTAAAHTERSRNLRIVGPQLSPRLCIERHDQTPGCGEIHDTVDDEWRRFLIAVCVEIGIPGEAQVVGIVGRDGGEGTESLLAIRAAVG